MSHHILPRPCTGPLQATAAPPTASPIPPSQPLCPLSPNPSPAASHHGVTAGDCLLSLELEMQQQNPSPGQGERQKGGELGSADPSQGAKPLLAQPVSWSHIPSTLGSLGAFLWVLGMLPLSLSLCSFCSRGKRAVVHQPGLAGCAQPPGCCHGRQDLRGLPAAPQEEISPPAQEVQPPPVTEPGILELAAKRPRLIRC